MIPYFDKPLFFITLQCLSWTVGAALFCLKLFKLCAPLYYIF